MKTQTRLCPLWASAAMLTAVLLALAPLDATPQTKPSAPGTSAAKAVRSNPARPAARPRTPTQGTQEGIKVHGQWIIEVRNPDGTVVTRREFENALVTPGLLALILGRQNSVGLWLVVLCPPSGSLPCPPNFVGVLLEPADPQPISPGMYKTLSVNVSGQLPGGEVDDGHVDGHPFGAQYANGYCGFRHRG